MVSRTMRILLVVTICLSSSRVAGAEPSRPELTADVLERSSREAPPQRFLGVLADLKGTGLALRKGVPAQGWAPKAPCGDQTPRCATLPFCVGLRTAYWTELHGKPFRFRFEALAWTYDTPESARRARDHLRVGPMFFHVPFEVIAEADTTLILLWGHGPDAREIERMGVQLRKRLALPEPPHREVGTLPECPKPRPPLDRLLSPDVADADLPSLVAVQSACEPPPSDRVAQTLNTRGMRFYKTKDYARADTAFALADRSGGGTKALYNRACVAALRGDAVAAAWMLWRLLYRRSDDSKEFLFEPASMKQALHALTDKDFSSVRSSPLVEAVRNCVRKAPKGHEHD